MMGAGKSSVARALGTLAERTVFDTDTLLQQRFGRPVHQIFQVYGEDAFRDHETSILKGLEPGPCVLSTGGGIVVKAANWIELRRLGTTVYLEAASEVLAERLRTSKRRRPLLEVEHWEQRLDDLLEARKPLYAQADLTVAIDRRSVDEVAEDLYNRLAGENS